MKKVIIAGGRDFDDYLSLDDFVCRCLGEIPGGFQDMDIQIISGGAKGADSLGERFAKDENIPLIKFPANWNKHGKAAGPIRNKQMAETGDILIAFWDGNSRGTKNMIDLALEYGLETHIYRY